MLELIKSAPTQCGVYLFKKGNRVLYVGKAKNIRERLLQHYKQAQENKKEYAIVNSSDRIDWILTRNEYEALVLEVDLIQLHKPKYNVLHKYGGGYPLLLLTEDEFPTIKVVRGSEHGGKLFGPFFTAKRAYRVKRLIHKLFKLRTCDPMPTKASPCMDYHLGLCSGPCAGLISKEDYSLAVKSAQSMLSGEVSEVLPELYQRLEEHMERLEFEKCALIRDQIRALEKLSLGQSVSGLPYQRADLFYRIGRLLGVFLIRSFKLVDKEVFLLETEEELEETIIGFYYSNPLPEVLLLNFELSEEVKRWLSERGKVEIVQKIDQSLEELVKENLHHYMPPELWQEEFLKVLKIPPPRIIEGFDVSHFYGDYTVASCVVRDRFGLPIKVLSLAKEEEILLTEWGQRVRLKEHPILYRIFGQIRDEAHRFALSYNRRLRLKEGLKDILDRIKGIGEVKKKIIYNNFENLYELLKAEDRHLKKLGIDPSIKQEIEKYLT
jgi:excinuclease ABC subunit C